MEKFQLGKNFSREMDEKDNLICFRDEFFIPEKTIYFDGNSLGLMSKEAEKTGKRVMEEWKELAINGWSMGNPPWVWFGEYLGKKMAPLVGADEKEVVVANSITINIHNLIASFYKPQEGRKKIIVDAINFPTDLYAIKAQMELKGVAPEKNLIVIESHDGNTINEEDVISAMDEETSIMFLPSVQYRSGQLLNMELLTKEAQKKGILVGFDLAHSIGIIPHKLSEWGVDFAVWCNYKWLNSGPGSTASIYINKRHFGRKPAFAGWWGHEKGTQFEMRPYFTPASDAAAFQTGTIPMLSSGPIEGSLNIILSAGIEKIRVKSLNMTEYFLYLVDKKLSQPPYNFSTSTPRKPMQRGGHVALSHPSEAFRINEALKAKGVVGDFRPPDVIRLAPSPLYNTYSEIWDTVEIIKEVIENKEFENYSNERGEVT